MQAQNTLSLFVACVILPLATAVGPSGLTQPGAPVDCILWYLAEEGDTASTIAAAHNIPLATFMDANPQLSGDPLALWKGYRYCVSQDLKVPPTKGSNNYYPITNFTTGNATAGSETSSIAESSSYTDEIDSTSEESSVASKDSTTLVQSIQPSQMVTESRSTKGSQSKTSSQWTVDSEPTTVLESTSSSESSKSFQLKNATQESDTSSKSESVHISTTQTTTTTTSIAPQNSTTIMAIPAPTKDETGAESGTQGQTQHASDKDSGRLAESFGAVRRDS